MNMFITNCSDDFKGVYICIKSYQVAHFKYTQFIVYKLYSNKAVKKRKYSNPYLF